MIAQKEVRMWLLEHNFAIIDEELVAEGHKIYNVIVAAPGEQKFEKEIYYSIGKKLIEKRDSLLVQWINKSINTMKKIVMQLEDNHSDDSRMQMEEYKKKIWEYKKIKEIIERE